MKAQLLLTLNCMAMIAFGSGFILESESDIVCAVVFFVMMPLMGFTIGLLSTWGFYIERD
jgi:hypothetical protein